jgi:hypothetical protein
MNSRENFRISRKESIVLELFCDQESRGKTDVVRELIRSLEGRLNKESYSKLLDRMSDYP